MAVRPIEIPQLAGPVLQRAGGQHPVLVLDDLAHFALVSRCRSAVLRVRASINFWSPGLPAIVLRRSAVSAGIASVVSARMRNCACFRRWESMGHVDPST